MGGRQIPYSVPCSVYNHMNLSWKHVKRLCETERKCAGTKIQNTETFSCNAMYNVLLDFIIVQSLDDSDFGILFTV